MPAYLVPVSTVQSPDQEGPLAMARIEGHLNFVTKPVLGETEEGNHIAATFPNTFHQAEIRLWGYEYREEVLVPIIAGMAEELYKVNDPDPVFRGGRGDGGELVADLELSIVDLGLIVSIDIAKDQGVMVNFQTTINDCGLKAEIQTAIEQAVRKFAEETLNVPPEDIDSEVYIIQVNCQPTSNWTTERATELIRQTVFKEGFLQTLQDAQTA